MAASTTHHQSPTTAPRHGAMAAALLGVLLGAFALRLPQLGAQSLWYDETVSVALAQERLWPLITHTARDIHPPLYYILLHFWGWLTGYHEFSSAYFSLGWGVLLVASVGVLGRWLGGRGVGLLAATLVALSPLNVWYSQEVRMYTMAATLGVWSLMTLWALLTGPRMRRRWQTLWLLSAVAGMYTVYYFAFLLIAEALIVLLWRRRVGMARADWRRWLRLAALLLGGYSLWIPTAVHQAIDPPVPPWRTSVPVLTALRQSLGALAVGQSLDPLPLTLPLLVLAAIMGGGVWHYARRKGWRPLLLPLVALAVPLGILLLSGFTRTPLYHPRYLFPYSPAFYLLMAFAFWEWVRWAWRRAGLAAGLALALLLVAPLIYYSSQSLYALWNASRYAADDLRGGVAQVDSRWRTGDVLVTNAGYTYTAFDVYAEGPLAPRARLSNWQGESGGPHLTRLEAGSIGGKPSLGWGDPASDFYATTAADAIAGLEHAASVAPRLWHFRLYDTVNDPDGVIRAWLEQHGRMFADTVLSGESNARVQGWYFPPRPDETPARTTNTLFVAPDAGNAPQLALAGIDMPRGTSYRGGEAVDVVLWLKAEEGFDPQTNYSMGLFDTSPTGRQWAVADEQPFGPLLSLHDLPGLQRWPVRVTLPVGLPPGRYELRLKFYRRSDGAVLLPTNEFISPTQALVSVIEVGPTRPGTPVEAGTPLYARFGALELLGHSIPPGPWQPGSSIPVELLWRAAAPMSRPMHSFLSSDVLDADDGGLMLTSYPTDRWAAGEVVRDIHYLTVSPTASPGDYPLTLRVSQDNVQVSWRRGPFRVGTDLALGTLSIEDRPRRFDAPPIETPLDVTFPSHIQLIGATLPPATVRAGDTVPLLLHWLATERPTARQKIFAHLIGPDGNLVAQQDIEPGEGTLPTNGWAAGEYVSTPLAIPLSPTAPLGTYELRIGLYDSGSGARAMPQGEGVNAESRFVTLATFTVEAAP